MSPSEQFDYTEKRTFWGRFGFAIGVIGVGGVVVVLFSQMFSGHAGPPPRRTQEVVMIRPLAQLPPPPPPPPQELIPRPQNSEQTLVNDQDVKPDNEPKESPPSLGTGIQGNGPDAFGLGRRDTGIFAGQGQGGGDGTDNRFGSYFSQIREELSEALRQNALTRGGSFDIKVRIWADLTGRITRAKLVDSTGDPTVDRAITDTVLVGRRLPDTPDGMRMPIELHFTARRPN